jgi:hypothetical protein
MANTEKHDTHHKALTLNLAASTFGRLARPLKSNLGWGGWPGLCR